MPHAHFLPQASPGASYAAQKAEIDAAVARVLAGGRYILGDEVSAFEKEFAAWLRVRDSVGVASGTDALELALRVLGIGRGDAVFAPSHTAVATIAAIERAGARPVLVEVDPRSYTMSAARLEAVLANRRDFGGCRPAAIIPVHLYGHPADMPALLAVAAGHGLKVIEDCAQSTGASLSGRRTGTFGDVAAFSFYPTKNLGALGDGGLVATNDPERAAELKALRQYGWRERSVSAVPGINSRLDEIQAAVLRVKLKRLDSDNARRIEIARRYRAGLARAGVGLPQTAETAEHVFHQFVVRTPDRDDLRRFLEARQIGTAVHYPVPVHRQPAYRDRGLEIEPLTETEKLCGEILSLPLFPQMTDADVDHVIASICEWSAPWIGKTGGPSLGPST